MESIKLSSTIFGGIAVLSLAYPSTAQVFSGTSSGVFKEPIPANATFFSGVGTNEFIFGTPAPESLSNQLTFTGTEFAVETDTPFEVGTLTYLNGETVTDPLDVDLIPLTVTLDASSPESFLESFTFTLDIDLTLNLTDDPVLNADFITPAGFFPEQTFTFAGEELTLELLGFEQDGDTNTNFVLPEDDTVTAGLIAQITTPPLNPVTPDPPFVEVPVTYDFTVDIDDGPLFGNQYTGNTTFDLTAEIENPGVRLVEQPAIDFNFVDNLFTEADDVEFPNGTFPSAAFIDGSFGGLTYLVDETDAVNPVDIPGEVVFFEVFLDSFFYGTQDNEFTGSISYTQRPPAAVPEPSALAGLILFGVGCLTGTKRLDHKS